MSSCEQNRPAAGMMDFANADVPDLSLGLHVSMLSQPKLFVQALQHGRCSAGNSDLSSECLKHRMQVSSMTFPRRPTHLAASSSMVAVPCLAHSLDTQMARTPQEAATCSMQNCRLMKYSAVDNGKFKECSYYFPMSATHV